MDGLVVALDGPGSSGKSSVGAAAAQDVGYRFFDTGLLYRALTWLAEHRGVSVDDPEGLVDLVKDLELGADQDGRLSRVIVDGVDQTGDIEAPAVEAAVSSVAAVPEVREALLGRQRELAEGGGIVMAGRDIGTIVLPDADLKVYLDVSVEERARRRALERGVQDDRAAVEQIEDELRARDAQDSSRETAPLRIPDGATVIRTDGNSLEETIAEVVAAVRAREGELERGR